MPSRLMHQAYLSALVVALVTPLAAASWEPAEVRIEDATGDVRDGIQPVPHGAAGDIEAAWLSTDGESTFTVGVDFVEWPDEDGISPLDIDTQFSYGGRDYLLEHRGSTCGGQASLAWVDPTTVHQVDCIESMVDEAEGVVEYTIPSAAIRDSRDLPIHGGTVDALRVATEYGRPQTLTDHGTLQDRAPDDGFADPLVIEMLDGDGPVRLVSDKPVVSTNGERTTYVWGVTIVNHLTTRQDLILDSSDLPEGWRLFHPVTWSVEGQGTADLTIGATVPSQHVHGEDALFTLHALDGQTGEGLTDIALGLRWLDIPQPTRHHPDLFLHVSDDGTTWMNAAGDDPGATEERLTREPGFMDTPTETQRWQIPQVVMSPKLFQGLEFDLNRTATLTLPVQWNADTNNGGLRMVMSHCETGVVDRSRDGGCTNPDNGQNGVEWQIIDADVGGLEFKAGQLVENQIEIPLGENLRGRINASDNARVSIDWSLTCNECSGRPNPDGDMPWMDVEGFRLRLPLREYADDAELSLRSLTDFHITADQEVRRANPGDRVVFPLHIELRNRTSDVDGLMLGFTGSDTSLVIGRPDQGTVPAWAIVEIAEDTTPGALVDGAVMFQSDTGSAAIRLQIDVVDPAVEDIPSDPLPDTGSGKRSPALGLLTVLAALVLVRRRSP